jgi:hypothetical protein
MGQWQVAREMQILRETLGEWGDLQVRASVTWKDFERDMRDVQPHVVHVIATGVAAPSGGGPLGQALAFLTERGAPAGTRAPYSVHGVDALRSLVASDPELRLLVLNGCKTDGLAAGVARVAPAVIAHRGDITDPTALAFAQGLYGALTRGLPFEAAITAARLRVDSDAPGGREWSAPVLYQQRGDGTFLAAAAQETPRPANPPPVAPPAPPSADRDLHALKSLLAIHEANLAVLRERDPGSQGPAARHVARQIEDAEAEIARLRVQVAAARKAAPA